MMFFVTAALVAAYGVFYVAPRGYLPSWAHPICVYDDQFCQNPQWLLYAAGACLVWALFLKVDRI